MEHKFLVTDLDSMAGIGTTLETHDDIRIERQKINNLGFSFIAPLGADHNTICHNSFVLFLILKREAPRHLPGALFRHKDSN